MEFARLVDRTVDDSGLRSAIDGLVVTKRAGVEMGDGPRIPILNEFIDREIVRFENLAANMPKQETSTTALNQLFRDTLDEVWKR